MPGHVVDLVPTARELAGLDPDGRRDGEPERHGRSLVPAFAEDQSPRAGPLWWLHEENRAIRVGNWKLVATKGEPWELYDLSTDRCETKNLAREQPERVAELAREWESRTAEHSRLAQGD
jgi:arylsulfatase